MVFSIDRVNIRMYKGAERFVRLIIIFVSAIVKFSCLSLSCQAAVTSGYWLFEQHRILVGVWLVI